MKNIHGPIALLGTSADPPTYGHQALLKGLLTLFPRVATWASNNPMKSHGESLQKRQALLKALVQDIANPHLELVQDLSSPRTIISLELANAKWPNTELIFVVGSDLASQIPNWVDVQKILQKARLGIAPRDGWPLRRAQIEALEDLGGRIDLLPLKIPATASSGIRSKPEATKIPEAILPILLKQNLYGLKSKS